MNPIEPSAKAIIVREDQVLLVRYVDTSFGLGTWYSLPGGRQQFGEDLREAAVRECHEEIGATVSVGELLFVREYIHARHELAGIGRDQHKIEFMFLCELTSVPRNTGDDADQDGLEWVALDKLETTNIYPTQFKNEAERIREAVLAPRTNDLRVAYWGDVY